MKTLSFGLYIYFRSRGFMTYLSDAPVASHVRVQKVLGTGPIKRRIMDMGITKNTEIYIRKFAPLGDPIQINLRGYELTIRKDDAKNILVEAI